MYDIACILASHIKVSFLRIIELCHSLYFNVCFSLQTMSFTLEYFTFFWFLIQYMCLPIWNSLFIYSQKNPDLKGLSSIPLAIPIFHCYGHKASCQVSYINYKDTYPSYTFLMRVITWVAHENDRYWLAVFFFRLNIDAFLMNGLKLKVQTSSFLIQVISVAHKFRYDNTSNKIVQLVPQHCCVASCRVDVARITSLIFIEQSRSSFYYQKKLLRAGW